MEEIAQIKKELEDLKERLHSITFDPSSGHYIKWRLCDAERSIDRSIHELNMYINE
jgi:hypothetical protein